MPSHRKLPKILANLSHTPMTATQQADGDSETPIPRVPLFRVSPNLESLDSGIDRRTEFYRDNALRRVTKPPPERVRQAIFTLPTLLTLLRIVLVPVLIFCWYAAHLHAPVATAAVFILASVTDWLDGYLARRMGIATAFGAFLDPVADKIMVSTALVLLATGPPPPISVPAMTGPVAAIIAREITMSSLREWAASAGGDAHKAVKVSSLGKWKTALQMTSMSILLVLRNDHLVGDSDIVVLWLHRGTLAAYGLLLAATALALWSLARYMENVWEHFSYVYPKKEQ